MKRASAASWSSSWLGSAWAGPPVVVDVVGMVLVLVVARLVKLPLVVGVSEVEPVSPVAVVLVGGLTTEGEMFVEDDIPTKIVGCGGTVVA